MSERFLKLNTTQEKNHPGDWLAINYPHAFIVLYFIARRARRHNGHPDGLIIGDALIGSSDLEPKITRQNFRTAIEKLVEFGYIKIVSNGKSFFHREKSTIKVTITGMLVNICDTSIWDINPDDGNQPINQRPTNDQPTGNHKQEGIRKNKKEEEDKNLAQPASRPRSKSDGLSFDFEKWEYIGITEKDMTDWKTIYPEIDLNVEITKSIGWLKANPSKNNKTLWRKFLTGWLQRANESASNKKAFKAASGTPGVDRRTKDIDGNPIDNQHKGKF